MSPLKLSEKGLEQPLEPPFLAPQSSEIELLHPLSWTFEAPNWSLSRFSDSFRREILVNPHRPGLLSPGLPRRPSRQLSHNALQTLLAPVPCWGHWTGQQPLRLLKHTKQFR